MMYGFAWRRCFTVRVVPACWQPEFDPGPGALAQTQIIDFERCHGNLNVTVPVTLASLTRATLSGNLSLGEPERSLETAGPGQHGPA